MSCERNISSSIAVNSTEFAASFAGSANRGSVSRSGRPTPFARAGHLSGVRTSTNQISSEVRYILISAFGGFNRSCRGKNVASQSAPWTKTPQDQTPTASSEVVTYEPFPVRSRRYRAVTIAENRVTAVAWSPLPDGGRVGGAPASRVSDNKPD